VLEIFGALRCYSFTKKYGAVRNHPPSTETTQHHGTENMNFKHNTATLLERRTKSDWGTLVETLLYVQVHYLLKLPKAFSL
jgi:hypothetical protein